MNTLLTLSQVYNLMNGKNHVKNDNMERNSNITRLDNVGEQLAEEHNGES
jgi:hypothetical protein